MQKDWSIGELLGTSSAYWKGCTLQAGVRLEIFTLLDGSRLPIEEICSSLDSDQRGTELLLNALCSMGLLTKKGSTYISTSFSAKHLSCNSPSYMGHIILHHHHILDGWAQLDKAVKKGQPIDKRSYGEEVERESFIMGMFNVAKDLAPIIASQINFQGKKRLLDLGGGPGTYAIHFCLANPDLQSVIFDRPSTRPFALQTIKNFNLENRIHFVAGDFTTDPISQGPYDIAWLSHILHSNSHENCQAIITKTLSVLEPGGTLYIHDFILNPERTSPEYPALFALNMLINNMGRTYSDEEILEMLQKGGAKKVTSHPFQGPNGSRIVYGTV